MFLLVPAYPGCPGSKAVKRSLLLLLSRCCRFINARRHVIQPAASAAADLVAAAAADNQESSAAKRMRSMLQSEAHMLQTEARLQFWSPPPPHATSVSYMSHAAAVDEAHSLSSTPSSTVSVH